MNAMKYLTKIIYADAQSVIGMRGKEVRVYNTSTKRLKVCSNNGYIHLYDTISITLFKILYRRSEYASIPKPVRTMVTYSTPNQTYVHTLFIEGGSKIQSAYGCVFPSHPPRGSARLEDVMDFINYCEKERI